MTISVYTVANTIERFDADYDSLNRSRTNLEITKDGYVIATFQNTAWLYYKIESDEPKAAWIPEEVLKALLYLAILDQCDGTELQGMSGSEIESFSNKCADDLIERIKERERGDIVSPSRLHQTAKVYLSKPYEEIAS